MDEAPILINLLSVAVMTCPFKQCNWQSEDVRTMSLADQNHLAGEHLQHHRSEITRMFEAIA